MKLESNQWKLPVLIGSLVGVALLINYFFFTQQAARREIKQQDEHDRAAAVVATENAGRLAKEKEEARRAAEKAATQAAADRRDAEARAEAARKQVARKARADEQAAQAQATQVAAEERARYRARYLNSGFERQPGVAAIGVAIASEQGTVNYALASALTRRLQTDQVRLLTSFFKPEFMADQLLAEVFSGQTAVFTRLELANFMEGVLVGRQRVEYSTNAALENTVTANLHLELMALPVALTSQGQSWDFVATGAGFRPQEARKLAEERLIEQIDRNTNLVLAPHLLRRP
jgi:hypothetical protein